MLAAPKGKAQRLQASAEDLPHGRRRETLGHAAGCAVAFLPSKIRIGQDLPDAGNGVVEVRVGPLVTGREGVGVALNAHLPIADREGVLFGHEVHVARVTGSDNGLAQGHGLGQDQPETLGSVQGDTGIAGGDESPGVLAFQVLVDNDRKRHGKFIVTGSSQFAFMKKVSESLAGRIGLITLLPFQFSEVPARLREASLFQGGYPELIDRRYEGSFEWYTSYLDTYLTRDVRDLREIGDIRDFRRFIQILAARVSQIMNMSDISRDLGISVMTVKKWLSVLEASFIIMLLPPFYKNLGKRIIKSPKLYFLDTGLVSYLTGIRTQELYEQGPLQGALFENYVITEMYKKELHTRSGADLYYFRESNGNEIDVILDRKSEQEYCEIKSSHTFRPEMVRALSQLKNKGDQGYLLYKGKELELYPDIKILNYKSYLK